MSWHLSGQIIFDKRGKHIQWGKDTLLNKLCWENWSITCKMIKLDYFLIPFTKHKHKAWKCKTFRRKCSTLLILVLAYFWGLYLLRKEKKKKKAKISKWDYVKLKSFCMAKETIINTKRQSIECNKVFANDISNKRLISKIYKEHHSTLGK